MTVVSAESTGAAHPEHGAALLDAENVSIAFQGVKALDDLSFCVEEGGVTAVIGPNGAGKSTLFNCITGLYRFSGTITLDGHGIEALPPYQRIRLGLSRTFQTPTLIDDASVIDNVMFGAFHRTRSGMLASALRLPLVAREEREARSEAHQLLESLGASELARIPIVHGLPHRDRRLVEIARALMARPRLLLLDEPAAGSSHDEATELLDAITSHCVDENVTILLVEHNVPLVMRVARKIVVLNFGVCLAQGAPEEIRANPAVVEAYLGADNAHKPEVGL